MLSVDEALDRILAAFRPLPAEQVSLADGLGRVLAEDVRARVTQPPVAVSAMDGYAVRAADAAKVPTVLRCIGEAPAGGAFEGEVCAGEAVRIFTGGPLPRGADAIVIQEDTERSGDQVTVKEAAEPGTYIRPAGLDFRTGDLGVAAGRRLTARDIGLAAAMNHPWLMVRRRPRVAILATGDEVVMPGEPLGPNQIVSSNGPSLAALVEASGGAAELLGIAPDSEEGLRHLARGARGADLLVTSGGASVGEHDLVQRALAAENLGADALEVDFWKVAMRPGKPLIFGRLGETPLIGVPGNPVSSLVCGLLFVRPAIETMIGLAPRRDPAATAILGGDLAENDRRQDYLRATLSRNEAGELVATAFPVQDSSMLSRLTSADCLIVRPPHAPPAKAGVRVEIIPLGASAPNI
ncbi:MAG: molybdopterin molybdotransferase MoeA [Alphaproteobacteria bacterium]|nr:molybdopterin molybdotransferase MoeA [Alphaproteobacteria bacterium]